MYYSIKYLNSFYICAILIVWIIRKEAFVALNEAWKRVEMNDRVISTELDVWGKRNHNCLNNIRGII